MKRFFAFCMVLSLATAFTGCSEKTEVKKQQTVETPEGSTTKTETETVEKSGENPPETEK